MRLWTGLGSALGLLGLAGNVFGQTNPACPLLGPVFPPVTKGLEKSTPFKDAVARLTAQFDEAVKDTNTTIYVQGFSPTEKLFSYKYAPPSTADSLTTGTLNEDTVFRIGSVSKLLTVYMLLIEVGTDFLKDPITKWVPELAKGAKDASDPVQSPQWEKITLGQLASHMSGIIRNSGLLDYSLLLQKAGTDPESLGFPALKKQDVPTCDLETDHKACTRKEFLKDIARKDVFAITSPSNTPVYSNTAFQILGYALEAITNKTLEECLESSLISPLGLKHTSLEAPEDDSNAVIPCNKTFSWWNYKLGSATASGGMFSTASDLTAIGQSILRSSLLSETETRAWLKPISHTSELQLSVGMPWEIRRAMLPVSATSNKTRVVDLYTKNGLLGSYSSIFALSPDHKFGFVIMLAGENSGADMSPILPSLITNTMLPAIEESAREQAKKRFAGNYTSSQGTLALKVDDRLPGLLVESWTRGKVNVLEQFENALELKDSELLLYPVGLEGNRKIRFRGIYTNLQDDKSSGNVDSWNGLCGSWGGVDVLDYGRMGLDDFEFTLGKSGTATSITPRVWRESLAKVK